MLQATWLFIGVIAALATGIAVLTSDNGVAIVAGALGFIAWGIWGFGAFDITIVTDSGGTETFTYPAVAILGFVLGVIPGYIALTGPVDLVSRARDTTPEDL